MSAGRVYGGESAADRAARRHTRFLDAGLEVFGTVGFRGATVRQICRAAGVTDRYFYAQFASTEDLLVAVYGACLDRLRDAVLASFDGAGDDVLVVARRGLDAFLRITEDDPRLARVVWFEVLGVGPAVEHAYLGRMAEFGALLVGVLQGRVAVEPMSADALRVVADAAVGGISHTVVAWVLADYSPAREVVVATLARFLVGGVEGFAAPM